MTGAGSRPGGPRPLVDRLAQRCTWPPQPAVVLAVSGGADSLAMLVLACRHGLDVLAVHVDHGLRAGGAIEAEVVEAAARTYGARFDARSVQVPPGPNLEARARAARFSVLPPGVCTGHTADDRAETLLLNLLRGAGLDGLAAMARPGPAAHPIIDLRRSETAALCAGEGLEVVRDPSNGDLRFRRNQVRLRLLPLLDEIAGRDVAAVLARQAALLGDDAALLEELSAGLDPTDATGLSAAPAALARRAVRSWLRDTGDREHHPPSAAEVARVLAVARGESVACEVGGARRIARSGGRMSVGRPTPPSTPAGPRHDGVTSRWRGPGAGA